MTGTLALDIMCGSNGASRCSARKWFNFMGDGTQQFVPFQITYVTDEISDNYIPLDPKIIPCNKAVNVS